jgi:hypothetical protein
MAGKLRSPEKGNRRGNFDVVVLSPRLVVSCPTLEDFQQGRLAAPFVIEMGLDYDGVARRADHSRVGVGVSIHRVEAVQHRARLGQILAADWAFAALLRTFAVLGVSSFHRCSAFIHLEPFVSGRAGSAELSVDE